MKISETSGGMFAIVQGIECRLSTRSRINNKLELIPKGYEIDQFGFYRNIDGSSVLIPHYVKKVKNKMMKLGYIDFDFDSKPYALAKCYK